MNFDDIPNVIDIIGALVADARAEREEKEAKAKMARPPRPSPLPYPLPYSMSYWKLNPAKRRAYSAARKARKRRATAGWANKVAIGEIYAFAKIKTDLTGVKWEVDHIVPMKSKRVCGLHTDYNLQVIRRSENTSKGNRYWPDMP